MAHAILFPTAPTAAERGAKKGKSSLVAKELPFSEALLSKARAVYRYSAIGRFRIASTIASTRRGSVPVLRIMATIFAASWRS